MDYGKVRMGLALGSRETGTAQPLTTLARINRNEDMRRLRELVHQYGVKQVLVGLPLRLDGTRGEMAEEAERFANRVRKQIGVPVDMVDERLSSWEAERLLEEEFGRTRRADGIRKKGAETVSVDAVAAAVILRDYLNQDLLQRSERASAEGTSK